MKTAKQRYIDEANDAHRAIGSGVTVSDIDVDDIHVVAFMSAVVRRIAEIEKKQGRIITITPYNNNGEIEYLNND